MGLGAWTSTRTQGLKTPTREAVCRDPLPRKCSADWADGIGEQVPAWRGESLVGKLSLATGKARDAQESLAFIFVQ